MLDDELLEDAVNIILDKILTPVIYLYLDEAVEFICFVDSNTDEQDFADAEDALYNELGLNAEIVDIRSFDECDRAEITRSAELLYSENDLCLMLFEAAMAADAEKETTYRLDTLKRKSETGTYYTN